MIPDDVIQKVRERANIAEIVGEIVTLKRAGASLKGLCPFHGEKTPSFVVNPQQGTYHCFGCQAHGDSLTFIKEIQNLNFPEAVRALAARVGARIPGVAVGCLLGWPIGRFQDHFARFWARV